MAAPASAAAAGRGAMSTDNAKGLVLAVSSSAFIGASFIIKKMGLRRAADSGVRAAEDGGRGERRWRWGRWRVDRKLAGEEAVAGNRRALEALRELVMYPSLYARESRVLGLKWPRGLLLYAPGTGKTSLIQAMVRECNAHKTMINTYSVHKAHAGEGEKFLREAFSEAYSQASQGRPAVIFIDELDAICPRRDSRREQESRIVDQLLTLMDGNKKSSKMLPHIVVVASTNRKGWIDPTTCWK